MYPRKVAYRLGLRVKSLVLPFHKSRLGNLALLVVGIAYSRSVSLPKACLGCALQFEAVSHPPQVLVADVALRCRWRGPKS
jgi:hypothetical protein